jgi:hypothetical protein
MKCAIHQPQFLPWLGHLQKIQMAGVFVFLDNVQFQKNEFQNRNRIPGAGGPQWLTVPVTYAFGDPIRAVTVARGRPWQRKVWGTIEHAYGKAPCFREFGPGLRELLDRDWRLLSEINQASVRWLMDCFEIRTRIAVASDLPPCSDDRTGRLVDICRHVGAATYLSGSLAQRYLDLDQFRRAGIDVEIQSYEHPVYGQDRPDGTFVSHMSAIDGLFRCGGGSVGRRRLNLDRPCRAAAAPV